MKQRVDAGTDVAMIGAWDASQNASIVTSRSGKQFVDALQHDAADGHLFLIHTGADGGGQIDVYVDEPVPNEVRKQMRPAKGEFLIRVPSGRLIVGGAEDYRSSSPQITGTNSIVVIPGGDYALRCLIATDEAMIETPSKAALQTAIGVDDFRYYEKINRRSCFGYLTLLLFPTLILPLGWLLALVVTIVALVVYFYIQEEVLLERNVRYLRIREIVNETYKQAAQASPPTFIFELKRLTDCGHLKGGSIDLNDQV